MSCSFVGNRIADLRIRIYKFLRKFATDSLVLFFMKFVVFWCTVSGFVCRLLFCCFMHWVCLFSCYSSSSYTEGEEEEEQKLCSCGAQFLYMVALLRSFRCGFLLCNLSCIICVMFYCVYDVMYHEGYKFWILVSQPLVGKFAGLEYINFSAN